MDNSFLITILFLAAIAVLILFLRILRRRRATVGLETDASGFWRYHKATQFLRKTAYRKVLGQSDKSENKKKKEKPHAVAVIEFNGDVRCRQHRPFSQLIDEVEVNKELLSEVVIVLNSPGGLVSQYGHAYSQMERIRKLGISLTVCVDVVAASGGYLMSLPANKIIAAPFAVVGSVGVIAFVPNLRKFLLNRDIVPRTFSVGKYKRTVSLTDEETPEQIDRFQDQLEAVQRLFLEAVKKYRPQVKFEEIQTGAHWTAQESIEQELGLVDQISTSEEYLLEKNKDHDILLLSQKKSFLSDGIELFASKAFDRAAAQVEERLYLMGQPW